MNCYIPRINVTYTSPFEGGGSFQVMPFALDILDFLNDLVVCCDRKPSDIIRRPPVFGDPPNVSAAKSADIARLNKLAKLILSSDSQEFLAYRNIIQQLLIKKIKTEGKNPKNYPFINNEGQTFGNITSKNFQVNSLEWYDAESYLEKATKPPHGDPSRRQEIQNKINAACARCQQGRLERDDMWCQTNFPDIDGPTDGPLPEPPPSAPENPLVPPTDTPKIDEPTITNTTTYIYYKNNCEQPAPELRHDFLIPVPVGLRPKADGDAEDPNIKTIEDWFMKSKVENFGDFIFNRKKIMDKITQSLSVYRLIIPPRPKEDRLDFGQGVSYDTFNQFPIPGRENTIFRDKNTGKTYKWRWNNKDNKADGGTYYEFPLPGVMEKLPITDKSLPNVEITVNINNNPDINSNAKLKDEYENDSLFPFSFQVKFPKTNPPNSPAYSFVDDAGNQKLAIYKFPHSIDVAFTFFLRIAAVSYVESGDLNLSIECKDTSEDPFADESKSKCKAEELLNVGGEYTSPPSDLDIFAKPYNEANNKNHFNNNSVALFTPQRPVPVGSSSYEVELTINCRYVKHKIISPPSIDAKTDTSVIYCLQTGVDPVVVSKTTGYNSNTTDLKKYILLITKDAIERNHPAFKLTGPKSTKIYKTTKLLDRDFIAKLQSIFSSTMRPIEQKCCCCRWMPGSLDNITINHGIVPDSAVLKWNIK